MDKRIDIWICYPLGAKESVFDALSVAASLSTNFRFVQKDATLIYSEAGIEKVSNTIHDEEAIRLLIKGCEGFSWDGFATSIPKYNEFAKKILLSFLRGAVRGLADVSCHVSKSNWSAKTVLNKKSLLALNSFDRLYHNRGDDKKWTRFIKTTLPSSREKRIPPAPYTIYRILTEEFGWSEECADDLKRKYDFGLMLFGQKYAEPIK